MILKSRHAEKFSCELKISQNLLVLIKINAWDIKVPEVEKKPPN